MAAALVWVMVNPEVLSKASVSPNFESIPAAEAMRLLAEVGGARVHFEGHLVWFEPR